MKKITIAGKGYPVSFGTATFWDYTEDTGIDIHDFFVEGTKQKEVIRVIHYAFVNGASQSGKEYAGSIKDTMNLIDKEPTAYKRLTELFVKAIQEMSGLSDEDLEWLEDKEDEAPGKS